MAFLYPWENIGPNRYSLWQSRRLFDTAGIVDGPFQRPDLAPRYGPKIDRYCWDSDTEGLSENAEWYEEDPVSTCLVALRCFGLFSARQVRQKLVKRGQVFRPGSQYRFSEAVVEINSIPRGLREPWSYPVGVQSVRVEVESGRDSGGPKWDFVSALRSLTPESLSGSRLGFKVSSDSESVFAVDTADLDEEDFRRLLTDMDPNDYFIEAEFRDERLSSLTFSASKEKTDPFAEADFDKEIVRHASNT